MALTQLYASFNNYIPLNKVEKKDLSTRISERIVKKWEYILEAHEICKHYTFITEGVFRKFHIDNKGIEHNFQFQSENEWSVDIDSFYSEKPCGIFIQALENCRILQIAKVDIIYLFLHNPKYDRYFRAIAEQKIMELERRILQSISSTATERYLSFLKLYPNLSARIPNTQIASYLGITPEFLSTLRRKLALNPPVAL